MKYALEDLGIITAAGCDKEEFYRNVFYGDPPELGFMEISNDVCPVARVNKELKDLPSHLKNFNCRNNKLAFAAFLQIKETVRFAIKKYSPARVGVVMGSSTSGIDAGEKTFIHYKEHFSYPDNHNYESQHSMGSISSFMAEISGAKGPAYTISTACSSSAKALISARQLIKLGVCDAVITGGCDTLCKLTVNGFYALGQLSSNRMNPMSANRDGLNIGEGAAIFLMTRERGQVEFSGGGESQDAYHMSAPHPQGVGAIISMEKALADAEIDPWKIDYINLHGTATKANDKMESIAVKKVLGNVPASSTKPFTGHCLGAAGAIEAGILYMMLASDDKVVCPPHVFDGKKDDELQNINLIKSGETINLNKKNIEYLMSNSFAFGGNNCSIVMSRG